MPPMSRFLGRSAEKRFSTLCSDLGITCNPAQEDDCGWDHVVEFPHKPVSGVPADLQRSLPPIFVQTKSHEERASAVRMKLSNALALARSPNPCFVIVSTRARAAKDPAWHALHFWESAISKTMKRAREAARDGIPESMFHKKWISFNVTDADAQSEENLLAWIEQTVHQAGSDYAAAKAALRESVGFGPERYVGEIRFGPIKIEELIDHQLGLTESIAVETFKLSDRRFGIDVPLPIPRGPATHASMHVHPADQCVARFRGPDGFVIELDGEVFFSTLPGLPIEQGKARIKTAFVDIVWAFNGNSRFHLHFATADRRHPAELEKLSRLVSWAGQGPIDLQVRIKDRLALGVSVDMDHQRDQAGFQHLSRLMSPLVAVCQHLRSKHPAISIEDVDEAGTLEAFHSYMTALDMRAAAPVDDTETLPHVDHAIAYGFTQVGDWLFGALTRWEITEQSVTKGVWHLKFEKRQLLEGYAFEVADVDALEAFKQDYTRYGSAPGALALDDALAALKRTRDASI